MIHGVVMAGGSGTRFWPVSRRLRPKQLLRITGGAPLVTETVARVGGFIPPERTWIVTHRDQVAGIREALPELGARQVLAEPQARNTCACAGLAATVISARDPDAILVTMPADHDIRPAADFVRTLGAACASVERSDGFVTFGIRPTYPATGYGYIHGGEVLDTIDGIPVRRVKGFREKPNAETAARFLATGEYLWNSGIFVWRARTLLDAIAQHEPAIGAALARFAPVVGTPGEAAALEEAYASIPSVSVDVGILERAPGVRVIDVDFQWSDVGSWDALDDLLKPDPDGHRVVAPSPGDVIGVGSSRCLVQSTEPHVIALVGVDDLVVVHTPDATLICRRGSAEDVKKVVERLARDRREDLL